MIYANFDTRLDGLRLAMVQYLTNADAIKASAKQGYAPAQALQAAWTQLQNAHLRLGATESQVAAFVDASNHYWEGQAHV